MTLENLKPVLPDYLVQAVSEASAAMREASNISTARGEVKENLSAMAEAVAAAEAELGDLEAESLLRRKPDPEKTAKLQEKLEQLRAEQNRLIATDKSLEQRAHQQDEAVVSAYGGLTSARRKLGRALLIPLNEALEEAVRPLQEVLEIVRSINHFVDFSEYSYPLMETLVPRFGGQRHLIFLGTHYSPEGLPRNPCETAVQWKETLADADQTLSNMLSIAEHCRRAIEHRKEKAVEERMREERLKPRYV